MWSTRDAVILGIFDKSTVQHVGNLSLQGIDWIDRRAELAILVGEPVYGRGGHSTEACRLLLEFGFGST